MLRLRDLLTKDKPIDIEYRCNAPKGYDEDDMLFGYCHWDGKELISGDGDNYYLRDIVERYQCDGKHLTIWIEVEWNGEGEIDV